MPAQEKAKEKMASQKIRTPIKISDIMTTSEKIKMKQLTREKFNRLEDMLINYSEVHTTMNFYPRQTRQGPRAVILPDCEPLLVHEFYVAGLIDTIYCKEARLLLELPAAGNKDLCNQTCKRKRNLSKIHRNNHHF